jgi:hypothetical protein
LLNEHMKIMYCILLILFVINVSRMPKLKLVSEKTTVL